MSEPPPSDSSSDCSSDCSSDAAAYVSTTAVPADETAEAALQSTLQTLDLIDAGEPAQAASPNAAPPEAVRRSQPIPTQTLASLPSIPSLGTPSAGTPTLGGPTLGGPVLGGPVLGGATLGRSTKSPAVPKSVSRTNKPSSTQGVLSTILSGESFWPSEPRTLHEAGLTEPFLETMILKTLLAVGTLSGRGLAERLALPFALFESIFADLRSRKLLSYNGSAPLGDYNYILTEQGQTLARTYREACSYIGQAPVPLSDYILSVEAQAVSDVPVRPHELAAALSDVSIEKELFDLLGPAVNGGSGMFLYGAPGNGKSTIADRICRCYGQSIWIPRMIVEDGEIVKLFDPAYHIPVREPKDPYGAAKESTSDARWIRVRRPTVVVGGELTMDALELSHDDRSGVSTASLQMKSNCGCLLIDDFGRQRMAPEELLNRWIIPLEARHDFLTLANGKKFSVPFEQLILFSTNLEPSQLVDEAFLRRIPYKIEVRDPDEAEYLRLFEQAAEAIECEFDPAAVEHLLARHYRPHGRALRRCHPRDLLGQLRSYCSYHDQPLALTADLVDQVAGSYFTPVPAKAVPGTAAV